MKDPEAALDSAFTGMAKEKGEALKVLGAPEKVTPDGLDGAVMKCQKAQAKDETGKLDTQYLCMWADYSTLALVIPAESGTGVSLNVSAQVTADVRKDVRVKN